MLIAAFVAAPSWTDARDRFDRMAKQVTKLTATQMGTIIAAFKNSVQLHGSIYLDNKNRRLLKFLERTTGREFEIDGRVISEIKQDDDDMPF